MPKQSISILGLLLIGTLLFVGCNGPKGKGLNVEYVEGIVTLDGQPIGGVSITFSPKNEEGPEESASGYSDGNGIYKLTSMNGDHEQGAIAGEYIITASKIEVDDPFAGMTYDEEQAAMGRGVRVKQTHILHTVYRDRSKTPLAATVNKDKNKIDLELKSKP